MRLLIVGSTGLVGSEVLKLALADGRITSVVAPVRKPLPEHPKLSAPVVDFGKLPADEDWWKAYAVVCTLGTTMKTAGSKEAFRRVDYEYPMAVGKLARSAGTPAFILNSAAGADPESRFFYSKVKGEVERDLEALGFDSLAIFRPGLIGGKRDEHRPGERFAEAVLGLLGPVLPRGARINPAPKIARGMIETAINPKPGRHIVTSRELV